MAQSQTTNLNEGYTIVRSSEAEQKKLLTGIISPRRGPSASVPGLSMVEGLLAADEMFSEFGLEPLAGCVTGEMYKRPIPQVFRESDVKALTDLYISWLPMITDWLVPQVKAPYQTYNKISRVGWPGFHRPDNKLHYVLNHMPGILAGDLDMYKQAFIVMGVRVQAESKTKERDYLFVTDDDKIVSRTVTQKDRTIKTPAGPRVSSRTRLVFNLPIYNLVKQIWDTAVHNVFMKWPAFHHDMQNGNILPVRGYHLCLDIKHFERNTASCNRARSAHYGGIYARLGEITASIPFAVPTDSWDGARMLYVNRDQGWSDQYASGDSAVAPSQKEILMAVYANFFHTQLGYPKADCCNVVARGGDSRLTIRNYGDDNSIDGDESVIKAFHEYIKLYLPVEIEEPPRFLGFQWYPDMQKWLLPPTSYLSKVYLNERAPGSNFRKYPFLGWVAKREIYSKIGHPSIRAEIFPREDRLLDRLGVPWYSIVRQGDEDKKRAYQAGLDAVNPLSLLGKDYAMTPKEQIAAGTHSGLSPDATRQIITKLVGPEIQKRLNP